MCYCLSMTRWKLKTPQVRAQRALHGITIETIARTLGIASSTYHRWENGQAISEEALDAVLAALKTEGRHRSRLARPVGRAATPEPSCISRPVEP